MAHCHRHSIDASELWLETNRSTPPARRISAVIQGSVDAWRK